MIRSSAVRSGFARATLKRRGNSLIGPVRLLAIHLGADSSNAQKDLEIMVHRHPGVGGPDCGAAATLSPIVRRDAENPAAGDCANNVILGLSSIA